MNRTALVRFNTRPESYLTDRIIPPIDQGLLNIYQMRVQLAF